MATPSSILPGESHGQRSLAGYVHRVAGSQTRQSAQGADKEQHEGEDRSRQRGLSNNGRAGLFYLQTVSNPRASVPTVDTSRTVLPWA